MAANSRLITLQLNDGEMLEIDVESIQQSELLRDFAENGDGNPIPLLNVNSTTMKKVIQYMTHHKDDIPPLNDDENRERRTNVITAWDEDFLNINTELLFNLITAANYLNMKSLLDVTCKKVANMIKDKTPSEVRDMLGIKDHSTTSGDPSSDKDQDER